MSVLVAAGEKETLLALVHAASAGEAGDLTFGAVETAGSGATVRVTAVDWAGSTLASHELAVRAFEPLSLALTAMVLRLIQAALIGASLLAPIGVVILAGADIPDQAAAALWLMDPDQESVSRRLEPIRRWLYREI